MFAGEFSRQVKVFEDSRTVALSNKPGIFPVGKMPNRVFLTLFSLDYYEFKWSKLRISSAKSDFVGQSHVSATAP